MKNYEPLGKHIKLVDIRNTESVTDNVLGINIDKYFMPSVANVIGTDLSKYKLLHKGLFACNPMHVGRDKRLPVALYEDDSPAIVSPAYFMFDNIDPDVLNAEYLMMWFRRPEFDRLCWLKTDGSVRGGITWDDLCRLEVPVIPYEEQLHIVKNYRVITDRIDLKRRINDNLLSQAQTYFSLFFSDKGIGKPLPKGWKVAKVGDYCVENVANLSKADTFDTILYLDTGSIKSNYIVELQELNLLTDEIPSRAKRKVAHGDIIYSTVRPNLRHYGLLHNPPENFIVSTGFAVLHNKGLEVTNEFLFMWLTTESIIEYLQAVAENSVSTYPSLNISDLMNVRIIVPDTEVLERITHFLTSIFTAISENNRQIQMLTRSLDTLLPRLLSSY